MGVGSGGVQGVTGQLLTFENLREKSWFRDFYEVFYVF